jgi:hypothetical protein
MANIKSLHPTHFSLQQLDEELQCMAAIRALPEEYSGFTTSLFLLDKLTLPNLHAAFHNQEQNVQLRETTLPAVAMKATTSLPTHSSTCQCTWCLHIGHTEDNCYTKKHSQQRDRTRASAVKGKRPNSKSSGELKERGTSAEMKEESASLISVDPSSPTSSDWNTDTGASPNMTPHRVWFKMYTPHIVPSASLMTLVYIRKALV